MIQLFETLGAIRIKDRLRKSKIFLDDESGNIDNKDFAVNKISKCDFNATQRCKVIIENNNIFKENSNKKGNNVFSTYMA